MNKKTARSNHALNAEEARGIMQDNVGPSERIQTTLELIIEEHFGAQTSQEFKTALK